MLVLSDMSGPTMVPGFLEYLTGYPLHSDSVYVLARTWYAPEMERPGCVWTHSLLLPMSLLRQENDLTSLLCLFRRPSRSSFEGYNKPIYSWNSVNGGLTAVDRAAVTGVVSRLYGSLAPLFVVVEDVAAMESVVAAIWNQQWASLRSSFSFCTGAISVRYLDRRPLDLQLVSREAARDLVHEGCSENIIYPTSDNCTSSAWTESFLVDLAQPGKFRSLLSMIDGTESRYPAGKTIATIYGMCQRSSDAHAISNGLINTLAADYPSSAEGVSLKQSILGDVAIRLLGLDDVAILVALGTTPCHEAFPLSVLNIHDRALAIWHTDRDRLVASLSAMANCSSPISEAIVQAIADNVSLDDVFFLINRDISLAAVILVRSCWLGEPDVWQRTSVDRLRELLSVLCANSSFDQPKRVSAVTGMLGASRGELALDAGRALGSAIAPLVLDWYAAASEHMQEPSAKAWLATTFTHRVETEQWAAERPEAVQQVFLPILPLPSENQAPGFVWRLATRDLQPIEIRTVEMWIAFAQNLGKNLRCPEADSIDFIVATFPLVYEAAEQSLLPASAWQEILRWLPKLVNTWDRCKSMRKTLVDSFVNYRWPPSSFLDCLRTTSALRSVFESWGWSLSECRFLSGVIAEGVSNSRHEQHRFFLRRYQEWFRYSW